MEQIMISEEQLIHEKSRKSLLYWAIGSMSIFFGAFTSYYLVIMGNGKWLIFSLPDIFMVSTAVIIASSLSLYVAQQAVKANKFRLISTGLFITFLLGLVFCWLQFQAWGELISKNIVFAGRASNVSGSILYVITALHFAHIVFGLIALLVTFFRATTGKYTDKNHLGLSLCSIFWHFLDILWVVLFLFLYFNR